MLTQSEKDLLLALAREQIESRLQHRQPALPPPAPATEALAGAFVTLHENRGGRRVLRGCIGHIDASDTLYETVRQVSLSAAFQDYRFPPLTPEELEFIDLEISVLTPFARVTDLQEIEPGTHGLYVRRGARSGLLLPQVASERNWNRETFLSQTCVKAGLPEESWRLEDTEIYSFTAEVFGEI